MLEVVVGSNESVSGSVLKADTIAIIYAIEALDSSYDRLGGVMDVDQYPERDPSSGFGPLVEKQLETYGFRRVLRGRQSLVIGQETRDMHFVGRVCLLCCTSTSLNLLRRIATNYDKRGGMQGRRGFFA